MPRPKPLEEISTQELLTRREIDSAGRDLARERNLRLVRRILHGIQVLGSSVNFGEDQFPSQIGATRDVESCCNVNLVTDRSLDKNVRTIHAADLWLKSYPRRRSRRSRVSSQCPADPQLDVSETVMQQRGYLPLHIPGDERFVGVERRDVEK
jgi:hypothetical protein